VGFSIGARIGVRTGGAFKEGADVDDGGADADLCDSRKRRTTRQERQRWGRRARASSVMRKRRADGIEAYDGESFQEELVNIGSIESFAIEWVERNTAQRRAITRYTSEYAQVSVRIVLGVRKQRRRKKAKWRSHGCAARWTPDVIILRARRRSQREQLICR
jgi:hypothetical protein